MRTKQGVITSAKLQRTVTVTVHRHVFHTLYKKRFRRSKNFLVDTGDFTDLAAGDLVEITECRPLSKLKRFRITEVIKRAPRVSEIAEEAHIEGVMRHRKKPAEEAEVSLPSAK
ncbi:30S ribosomal protein S17 [Candidatus Peribacteria bacterium RIFCSPHIGHO2_02_FULL_53_20]|nr:MAG: 30S ribosomal protein S17 [Candidatus Peribacteria bacterium RIFCSPHIGHO2_02_FULL_53_20]OGJ67469.1 MAG: 30S ribosomal protein S17 [Candidatus Peribacteria bacterium RIFCSPLOWO2_01_FULL_53_10]OGJ70629.1 MAG: 30S ribosomal protein S17 [Candidatus Peribacteria bacterium RIFCSPLOWO2_12_FULL_53_10]